MMGETWALSPPGTEKNDLFNTLREHLTLNLSETVPDRSTMENGGLRQKAKVQRGEEPVSPCWPTLRRAGGAD